MLKTGILLLALGSALIWLVTEGVELLNSIVYVACGVIVSYAIFVAVLLAFEDKVRRPHHSGQLNTTRIGSHSPPTV